MQLFFSLTYLEKTTLSDLLSALLANVSQNCHADCFTMYFIGCYIFWDQSEIVEFL